MINIAFIGNPNVGKSALINKISNASLKIGNWAGVTVEKKEVFFKVGNQDVKLVDLPGIYSLTANTPEERVSRDYLLEEPIDVIINVVDSTAMEKNLYLTALLKEMGKPIVMALNFVDEFEKLEYSLDRETFEKQIGISTVFTSGRTGVGVDKLMEKAVGLAKLHKEQKHIPYKLAFDNMLENEISSVKDKLVSSEEYKVITEKYPLDWISIKTLEEVFNFLPFIKTKYMSDLLAISKGERKE